MECSIEGCDYPAKSRGWCQAHYMRWFTKGDPGPADIVRRPKGRTCSLEGCERKHQGRGYCDTHLQRAIKYGDPGPVEIEPRRPGAECSIEGCDYPAKSRGWCQAHYMRWFTKGDPGPADIVRRPKGRTCSLEGCERKHQGRGYCGAHLQRAIKYGDPGPVEIESRRPGAECSVDGCDRPLRGGGHGWCNAHYLRWRKYGDPLHPFSEHGHRWTGDSVGYIGAHKRIRAIKGNASEHLCIECGKPAEQWAYDYKDPDPKEDPRSGPYSTNPERYQPMCCRCHKRFDVAMAGPDRGCSVDGCDGKHKARGLCGKHYRARGRANSA